MAGHLSPAGVRVASRADSGEEHLQRCFAEVQTKCAIAVIEEKPIVAWSCDETGRYQDRLVPRARDLKEDLVLAFELNLFVVGAPREQHRPIGAN